MIKGSQISTKQSFQYGRFETMMKPAFGSGIISSFFLFNDINYLQNWQEVDFEIPGSQTNQMFTNIITTASDKNMRLDRHTLNRRASDVFWKLCIDWNKDRVIWLVNDVPVRTLVIKLDKPMKIMLNIWKSDSAGWAGPFDAGLLPQVSEYQYVKCNDWTDSFETLDLNRWQIADWKLDSTQLVKENVGLSNNTNRNGTNLWLKLT